MGKLKVIELILLAASALITAVKSVIKFIEYIGELAKRKQENGYA